MQICNYEKVSKLFQNGTTEQDSLFNLTTHENNMSKTVKKQKRNSDGRRATSNKQIG